MEELSVDVRAVFQKLFPPEDWQEITSALEEDCGDSLPCLGRLVPENTNLERIRLGVLKLSGGDIAKFRRAVTLAKRDWRDVLVAAGFANNLRAHRQWTAQVLE